MPPEAKARVPLRDVFATVMPYGGVLALGTLGFGVITSFVTLLFAARGWANAWVALSAYGAAFVLSRVFFAGRILVWGRCAFRRASC
jgi:hypothetical protein